MEEKIVQHPYLKETLRELFRTYCEKKRNRMEGQADADTNTEALPNLVYEAEKAVKTDIIPESICIEVIKDLGPNDYSSLIEEELHYIIIGARHVERNILIAAINAFGKIGHGAAIRCFDEIFCMDDTEIADIALEALKKILDDLEFQLVHRLYTSGDIDDLRVMLGYGMNFGAESVIPILIRLDDKRVYERFMESHLSFSPDSEGHARLVIEAICALGGEKKVDGLIECAFDKAHHRLAYNAVSKLSEIESGKARRAIRKIAREKAPKRGDNEVHKHGVIYRVSVIRLAKSCCSGQPMWYQ